MMYGFVFPQSAERDSDVRAEAPPATAPEGRPYRHKSWCALLWTRGGGYCNCGAGVRA